MKAFHPIESNNAEERSSVAFVAAERSNRASDLAPKMIVCDRINDRQGCWAAPLYLPSWHRGSFAYTSFCSMGYSSTYLPSKHAYTESSFWWPSLLPAGQASMQRFVVIKDKEGSEAGEEERPQ